MNVTNIGIGMLLSAIVFHVAISIVMFAWYGAINRSYVPGDPLCAEESYAHQNKGLCSTPGWAHSTPLAAITEALPTDEAFGLEQMVKLAPAILIAIVNLLYPNYQILYDVDPIIGIIITIIRIASIVSIMLLIYSAGRSIATTGLTGVLGRRF